MSQRLSPLPSLCHWGGLSKCCAVSSFILRIWNKRPWKWEQESRPTDLEPGTHAKSSAWLWLKIHFDCYISSHSPWSQQLCSWCHFPSEIWDKVKKAFGFPGPLRFDRSWTSGCSPSTCTIVRTVFQEGTRLMPLKTLHQLNVLAAVQKLRWRWVCLAQQYVVSWGWEL